MNRESVPINLEAGGHDDNMAGLRTVWGTSRGTRPKQVSYGRPEPGNARSGAGKEAQTFHWLLRALTVLNPPEKQFPGGGGEEEHC